MSDTELALLRAIAAHPDEDTPRLAYADYLDETGGECEVARAEYIRIQITRQRGLADTAADAELYRREVALYVEFAGTWRRELPGYDLGVVAARRGFWHKARASADAILAAADNPFTHLIDELTISTAQSAEQLQTILRLPHAPWIVSLALPLTGEPIGSPGARALIAGFLRLEFLNLGDHAIGADGIRALCAGDHFPALRELHLCCNGIDRDAVSALLASPLFRRLQKLVLRANPGSRASARFIALRFRGEATLLWTD